MKQSQGNLETGERVASAALGVVLSLLAGRAGGTLTKLAAGTARSDCSGARSPDTAP